MVTFRSFVPHLVSKPNLNTALGVGKAWRISHKVCKYRSLSPEQFSQRLNSTEIISAAFKCCGDSSPWSGILWWVLYPCWSPGAHISPLVVPSRCCPPDSPLPEILWEQSYHIIHLVWASQNQSGQAKFSSKPALRIAERPQCHCRNILFSCSVLRFWTWCELAHLHCFCSKVTSELFPFHFLPACQFYEDQTLMLV